MKTNRLFSGLVALLAIGTFGLIGCANDDFNSGNDGSVTPWLDGGGIYLDGNSGPPRPSCPGRESTITGTVFAPNGTDPVPGATIFVPSQVPELFPPEVKCEVCGSLGTGYNYWTTTSGFDGKFTLTNVCPGPRSLVLQNGRFRRFLTVKVPEKGTLALTAQQSRLPKRTAEFSPVDAIPRIAVVSGDYDKMECVLRKMGVEVFDLFEGAKQLVSPKKKPPFSSLLADLAAMKRYNIIFINCTDNTFEGQLENKTIRDNIANYVRTGGRLYVTDWSYDYIEQIEEFAGFIDFEPGLSNSTPEKPNAGAIGEGGLTVQATLLDSKLAQWLGNFPGTVTKSGGKDTAKIEHFLAQWVMMHQLGKDAKLWVEGPVSSGFGGSINNQVRPLTVTFNFKNCGKILFSSYHTEGRDDESTFFPKAFPDYCGDSASPQDRILEYLIFDIASCIKPIE